jgi:16S rRNA C967 or C1407 C5-methylase (RsmB/RsmF family)
VVAWVNPLRAGVEEVAALLAEDGHRATAIAEVPLAIRLEPRAGAKPLAATLAYTLGLLHRQELVSQLPPLVLAPQPEERALDLCAAPGGKTAQIATQMNDGGLVVANDVSALRLRVLQGTALRLGITSYALTVGNAAHYRLAPSEQPYDAVLADVPCSCEGTSRKNPEVLRRIPLSDAATMPSPEETLRSTQAQILLRALEACRAGGRVVYSTCTYAPEENEAVVSAVVQHLGETVRVRRAEPFGLTCSPGLTAWRGARFHPSAAHCLRFWPHQNDTGGFFIAALDKLA